MKSQLVASHAARRRRIESGEEVVVGVNRFVDDRAEPADRGPGHRDPDGRPDGRARRPSRPYAAWRAAPRPARPSSEALAELREAAESDANLMPADAGVCPGGGHHRGVGGCAARGLRRVPGPTGVGGAVGAATGGAGNGARWPRCARRCGGPASELGTPAAAARRQAGPGRALQRRRADRRTGARRRLRGGLPGHPADTRADRRGRGRGGRALRRAVDPVRLAPGADPRRAASGCREAGAGDVPVVVGGIIPDGRRAVAAARPGVAAVFTPEGLRASPTIMARIVDEIREANGLAPLAPR